MAGVHEARRPAAVRQCVKPLRVDRGDSPAADRAQADLQDQVGHALAALKALGRVDHDPVVRSRQDRDRVARHSNVQAARHDQLPVANALLPVVKDRAVEGRPIDSVAVSSICPAIVTSVGEVQSSIAGHSSNPAIPGPEGRAKATEWPNGAIVSRTEDKSRSRIEESG